MMAIMIQHWIRFLLLVLAINAVLGQFLTPQELNDKVNTISGLVSG